MDREDNIELLKLEFLDKEFSEDKLNLLCIAINEFDSLFGKYIPRNKLIELAKSNINEIEYVESFKNKTWLGVYYKDLKKIALRDNMNKEEQKSVFFHEFIHAILKDKRFAKKYKIEELEENGAEVYLGIGLDEGFTQYVTEIRNAAFFNDRNHISVTYPILTEQIRNLANLIGQDKFLDIGFNNPEKLKNEIALEDGLSDEYDYYSLRGAFDVILSEEKNIYMYRNNYLLKNLFNYNTNKLVQAKSTIIEQLQNILLRKPISTIEEFNTIYSEITKYCDQLDTPKSVNILSQLIPKVDELINEGLTLEEILNNAEEIFKYFYQGFTTVNEFKALSSEEKLEKLTDESFYNSLKDLDLDECYEDFGEELLAELANSIGPKGSKDAAITFFTSLKMGLAQKIKDNGYNIDRLSLEYIQLDSGDLSFGSLKEIISLYDTDIDKKTYLGSYMIGDKLEEFNGTISKEEKEELVKTHPELNEMNIISSESGDKLAILGEKYMFLDNKDGTIANREEYEYCQSYLEIQQNRIKDIEKNLERLEEVSAPRIIIDKTKEEIEEVNKKINSIVNRSPKISGIPFFIPGTSPAKIDLAEFVKNALTEVSTDESKRAYDIENQKMVHKGEKENDK